MLILVKEKISPEDLEKAAVDLDGYVKFVVDLKRGILTAGGLRHVEGEELLLKEGSQQSDLWGGGLDLQTGEMDFDSMVNIRPPDNPSREVLSLDLRAKIKEIADKLLKL